MIQVISTSENDGWAYSADKDTIVDVDLLKKSEGSGLAITHRRILFEGTLYSI